MHDPIVPAMLVSAFGPGLAALVIGLWAVLSPRRPTEQTVSRVVGVGLALSLLGAVAAAGLYIGGHPAGEIHVGDWVRIGDYAVPIVFLVDGVTVAFGVLSAVTSALAARFSRTYLHKEAGYLRFFVLLALFATGAQLISFAGAFDLLFAGWELVGVSSALLIGFFHERQEPVRSSLRAFATYRACDVAFFIAIVAIHELLGTTRLSVLSTSASLPEWERALVAGLLLVAAFGKSAQLPFSSWLPRAMEGPTPSSALFYGAVSVHAGLYLLLRVWPLLDTVPVVEVIAAIVGVATAIYGGLVARVKTDAKGALAHATLAQTGLILAEIALGFSTVALVHIVGHALLRLWQYLRAPNTLHDAHHRGHAHHDEAWWQRLLPAPWSTRVFAAAMQRLRLDERLDAVVAPLFAVARALERGDRRLRAAVSLDEVERTDRSPR